MLLTHIKYLNSISEIHHSYLYALTLFVLASYIKAKKERTINVPSPSASTKLTYFTIADTHWTLCMTVKKIVLST